MKEWFSTTAVVELANSTGSYENQGKPNWKKLDRSKHRKSRRSNRGATPYDAAERRHNTSPHNEVKEVYAYKRKNGIQHSDIKSKQK
ncbi:hypothetical protein P8452_61048 [Trifolium repens]|nr:hypothetical protein P8452_61048 [Trifolium repens]